MSEYISTDWFAMSNRTVQNVLAFTTIVVGLFTLLYIHSKRRLAAMRKYFNLPGPEPTPILGNLIELSSYPRQHLSVIWKEKFGKMSIHFMFHQPYIVISDREVASLVMVKDFEAFSDHSSFSGLLDESFFGALIFQPGARWKKMRNLLSPHFTSLKLKQMQKLIDDCSNDLVDSVIEQMDVSQNKAEFVLPAVHTYELFAINGVTSCFFGHKLARSKGDVSPESGAPRNTLIHHIRAVAKHDGLRYMVIGLVPDWMRKYLKINSTRTSPRFLISKINHMTQIRSTNEAQEKHDDFMQTMVNSSEFVRKVESSDESNKESGNKIIMNEYEIVGNAMMFFMDGIETTTATMMGTTYALAHHQDLQQRLFEEVSKIAKESKTNPGKYEFDYNDIMTCEYLDAAVCETLRMMPPAPGMDRLTTRDYNLEKYNLVIPKGTPVYLDFHGIHRDPDYWPEPNKWDPERFMPENKHKILPGTWIPFGNGPRQCLAMRFALMEVKMGIAKMVMAFKFTPIDKSEFPAVNIMPTANIAEFKDINVHATRR